MVRRCGWHNYQLEKNLRPARPRIDPKILVEQLESGNLSLQKADFFRVLGKSEEESSADSSSNQIPRDDQPTEWLSRIYEPPELSM